MTSSKGKNIVNKTFIWQHVRSNKGLLLLILLSVVLSSGAGFGIPFITQKLIDDHLSLGKEDMMIVWLIITFFGLIIAKVIGMYIISYFGRLFQVKIEFSLRRALFKHFEKINVTYVDSINEGKALSRINEDPINIASSLRFLPENLLSILLTSISSFTMAFIYDWIVGLALLGVFAILIALAFAIRKKFTIAWLQVKNENEALNQVVTNSITGIKETKSYSAEEKEIKMVDKLFDNLLESWKKNFKLYAKWMTWNVFVLSLISLVIISIGSWRVIYYGMPIGYLVALNMYGMAIIDPINKTLSVVDIVSTSGASIARMNEFLSQEEEDYSNKKLLPQISGEIEFKNVTLFYPNADKPVLENLSFKINKGEKVAFIGATGSGKSTILKALVRFYNPTEGKILLDGKDISEYNISSLRQQITYLQQDSYLFFDTIKYNVEYGLNLDTLSSEAKVNRALDIAKASAFVRQLPNKTLTSVGPKGVNLSGGQKQRLSIARAIVKDSPIVMFDEATSALDNITERELQEQLEEVMKDKTTIFIAHRLTTIKNVDRIFVISNGKIVEEGSHEQLLKKQGHYYDLWNQK